MQTLHHTSLGDQVSNKISAWIFVLVVTIIAAIFLVSFGLSRQLFNKQVNIWDTISPQQALTNLIDADHFSIKREVEFLKSTGLFSAFVIADNKKKTIAYFGDTKVNDDLLIPIQDDAKVIWGYYYFKPDFYNFIAPFLLATIVFLALVCIAYFVIRWRIRIGLKSEFSRFNRFLSEIEMVTEKLHELYYDDEIKINLKSTENNEQVIINRAITKLLEEIKKANHSLREVIAEAELRRFQDELTKTALQVVHDIGSPIVILELIQATSTIAPEENRKLIKNAISKIRDISNTLLKKAKHDFSGDINDSLSQHLLFYLVDQVVSEKRAQFSYVNFTLNIEKQSYQIFSFIKPIELSRVLSNLINNAVEAIRDDSNILITMSNFSSEEALIKIEDYGKGIPKNILSNLGELGGSFGKTQGTGVGLNHAINTIKAWGGRVEIQSEEGKGTIVQIFLRKCNPPSWFIPDINVFDKQIVVVIDDDEGMHSVWKMKLDEFQKESGITINLLCFKAPQELIQWKETITTDAQILYLCDYEFVGTEINGIDLIMKLGINHSSILVTSSVINAVLLQCEGAHIKVLPKNVINFIPICDLTTSVL